MSIRNIFRKILSWFRRFSFSRNLRKDKRRSKRTKNKDIYVEYDVNLEEKLMDNPSNFDPPNFNPPQVFYKIEKDKLPENYQDEDEIIKRELIKVGLGHLYIKQD